MKKLTLSLLTLAVSLWAADFWVAKPYTEWSEKDATKLLKSSPWAKEVTISLGGGGGGGMDGGGSGGRGGRNRGGAGSTSSMGEAGGGAVTPNTPGGGGAGGLAGSGEMGSPNSRSSGLEGMSGMGGGGQGMAVIFTWESAMVVKQAKVKRKYGSEAGTSEAAQKTLAAESTTYVLSVGPIRPEMARGGPQLKEVLMQATVLNVKGKTAIKPVQVEVIAQPTYAMLYFAFPKDTPLTAEDGEIEFVSKVVGSTVKAKFDLKKMVVNNKLDM
jgi:hypothetical protein